MKCNLSEIMNIIGGGTPKTTKPEYWNGTIPWLSVKDFANSQRYVYTTEKCITEIGLLNSSANLLRKDDTIISARGTVGELAMIPFPMAFNQSCYGLRAKRDVVDPVFLYYLMRYHVGALKKNTHGSVFDTITRDTFSNIEVEIPSLKLQKRIAAILSSLDDKIELNNKINANLEQQGAEFVRQYRSVTDVGVPLSDIMSFDNGFPFQSGTYLSSGRYRVITIKNVQDGYIDSEGAAFIDKVPLKMKPNCVLHVGDVLLSLTGNVGRVGIVCESGLLLNQRVAKIVPKKQELLPFLYFFYRQSDMKILLESIAKGTAQLNLSPVETLNVTVPYKEESAILLSRLLSRLFQKVVANTQENLTLAMLRDSLLPRLMSGQIELWT